MLVDAEGGIRGSLSGGCVEGAVLEACQEALETGTSTLLHFGVGEDDACAGGLMCGGPREAPVQPFQPGPPGQPGARGGALLPRGAPDQGPAQAMDMTGGATRLPARAAHSSRPAASDSAPPPTVAVLTGAEELERALQPLLPKQILETAASQAATMIRSGRPGTIRLAPPEGLGEPIELFIEPRTRPAHLVVFGANAFGQALVAAARPLDLRPASNDPASCPGAEVIRAWPHEFLAEASRSGDLDERSMICVLTHDPKVDVPALSAALEADVAYVGAMGSRRSDRERRAALREAGVSGEALARLRSPIGLDLGAVTPAEVAVAILAEILAVRANRSSVGPLRDGEGPLHPSTS